MSTWIPISERNTPPKPGPTEDEIAALEDRLQVDAPSSRFVRDWFADVTARIEREKGK